VLILIYRILRLPFGDHLGWGGGIRTPECQYQKLVPYHLATPHNMPAACYANTSEASIVKLARFIIVNSSEQVEF
jgi:hypothetical protein